MQTRKVRYLNNEWRRHVHLCIGNEKKFTNEFIQFVFVIEIILCLRIFVWRWKELVLISHSCVTLSVKVTYVLLGAFDNGLIIYKKYFHLSVLYFMYHYVCYGYGLVVIFSFIVRLQKPALEWRSYVLLVLEVCTWLTRTTEIRQTKTRIKTVRFPLTFLFASFNCLSTPSTLSTTLSMLSS